MRALRAILRSSNDSPRSADQQQQQQQQQQQLHHTAPEIGRVSCPLADDLPQTRCCFRNWRLCTSSAFWFWVIWEVCSWPRALPAAFGCG